MITNTRQFIVAKSGQWEDKRWGMMAKPDAPGKYPVIMHSHGKGQAGTTEASAASLADLGPLYWAKQGLQMPYVIVAIQWQTWSPEIQATKYVFENDEEIKQLWDGQNVMWDGISAGGQKALEAIALNLPGTKIVSSGANTSMTLEYSKPHKVLFFHDSNGDTVCPWNEIKPHYDKLKANPQSTIQFTELDTQHGGWNTYYDPRWKDPKTGKSVYDFAFGEAAPAPPKEILAVITIPKLGKKGTAYDDGSYVLS